MKEISTIGLDLAKSLFQVHGVASAGHVVVRRQLRRGEVLSFFGKLAPCLVGMEACGGAHYWAREIAALGHEVRLIPPAYVKPYVKRGKTDAADAEAICEAVTRPTMRFAPVKSAGQQASAMVLKTRDLLVRQRSQTINALRAHLGELGVVTGTGVAKVASLIVIVRDHEDARLPAAARFALTALADQIDRLTNEVEALERQLVAEVRRDNDMRGSRAAWTISTMRFTKTKRNARRSTIACVTGVSRRKIPKLRRLPVPGQLKTVSIRIEPPSM